MEYALSSAARHYLSNLARTNVLVAFDYDGTLAPIRLDPAAAFIRASTARLLRKLTTLYPCAVISGRTKTTTERMLGDCGVTHVTGNYGLEPSPGFQRFERLVADWREKTARAVAKLNGVSLEDKRYSLAVHYRRSREKKKVMIALRELVKTFTGARVIWGKQVCNLVPLGAPHKGVALERVREQLGCKVAIYLGDDQTDEDVFVLDEPGRLVGVRVGRQAGSHASYFVETQREIDAFLRFLIAARSDTSRASLRFIANDDAAPVAIDGLSILQALRSLERALDKTIDQPERFGRLALSERLLLRMMARHPGISAGKLAELLRVQPSTLTADFKALEGRRLIQRRSDPKDSRRALFVLSERGRALDQRADDGLNTLDRALAVLPGSTLTSTTRVLELLTNALNEPRNAAVG